MHSTHNDKYHTDFMKQLRQFRDQRFLCDVRVIAGDSEYPAHKMVLAASSLYFKDLFEPKSNGDLSEITSVCLKNCQPDCVTVVLNYLYSGELDFGHCRPSDVLSVARACKIASLEALLSNQSGGPGNAQSLTSPLLSAKNLAKSKGVISNSEGHRLTPSIQFTRDVKPVVKSKRPRSNDALLPEVVDHKENDNQTAASSRYRCQTHNCDSSICKCPLSSIGRRDSLSQSQQMAPDQSSLMQLCYNLMGNPFAAMAAYLANQQRAAAVVKGGQSQASPIFPLGDQISPLQNIPHQNAFNNAFNQHLFNANKSMASLLQHHIAGDPNLNFGNMTKNFHNKGTIPDDDEEFDETGSSEKIDWLKTESDFNSTGNRADSTSDLLSVKLNLDDADEIGSLVIDNGDVEETVFAQVSPKVSKKKALAANKNLTAVDSNAEQILADDRDGWCRNKKFIKKTPNGHFQCILCEKTYGRYNSVSYHVTIYHRNPPIVCDHVGCNFQTREARYIHFHKFYRHDVPLPANIDLDARRCPYCRHVAKSPAMLDKHMKRHENNGVTSGAPGVARVKANKLHQCTSCSKEFSSKASLAQHTVICRQVVKEEVKSEALVIQPSGQEQDQLFICDKCPYRSSTSSSLEQHKLFKHESGLWSNKYACDSCDFSCPSQSKLKAHKTQKHAQQQLQHHQYNISLPLNLNLTSPIINEPPSSSSSGQYSAISPDTTTSTNNLIINNEQKSPRSSEEEPYVANQIADGPAADDDDMKKFAHFLAAQSAVEGISTM